MHTTWIYLNCREDGCCYHCLDVHTTWIDLNGSGIGVVIKHCLELHTIRVDLNGIEMLFSTHELTSIFIIIPLSKIIELVPNDKYNI